MKKIFLITVLFSSYAALAQQEIVIIDKGDYKEKEIRLNDNTQAFKYAPLNILAGEINFSYEKQVSQKGSVEIGLGPTISNIGIGINSHYIDPTTPSVAERSGMGFFTSVAYRYYPLDATEALNRFYVSPIVKYKLMNSSFVDESGYLETMKSGDSRLNFYFNFGYQIWASKSFCIDFYGGVGIGYRSYAEYRSESYYEDYEWKNKWMKINHSGAQYVANMGIKVGIGIE